MPFLTTLFHSTYSYVGKMGTPLPQTLIHDTVVNLN